MTLILDEASQVPPHIWVADAVNAYAKQFKRGEETVTLVFQRINKLSDYHCYRLRHGKVINWHGGVGFKFETIEAWRSFLKKKGWVQA